MSGGGGLPQSFRFSKGDIHHTLSRVSRCWSCLQAAQICSTKECTQLVILFGFLMARSSHFPVREHNHVSNVCMNTLNKSLSSNWLHLCPLFSGFAICPAILQLILLPVCPESPRYLLIQKQWEEEARRGNLAWLITFALCSCMYDRCTLYTVKLQYFSTPLPGTLDCQNEIFYKFERFIAQFTISLAVRY